MLSCAAVTFVIAIDGPAASGKGTLASRLASHFGLRHLDTGLLYRGVGHAALCRQVPLDDAQALASLAAGLNLGTLVAEAALRGDAAAAAASKVSIHPEVRAALLNVQRQFAAEPPGRVLKCSHQFLGDPAAHCQALATSRVPNKRQFEHCLDVGPRHAARQHIVCMGFFERLQR